MVLLITAGYPCNMNDTLVIYFIVLVKNIYLAIWGMQFIPSGSCSSLSNQIFSAGNLYILVSSMDSESLGGKPVLDTHQ